MVAYIRKILAPPAFADEEKTRQAYMINMIIWAMLLAALLGLISLQWLDVTESILSMIISEFIVLSVLVIARRILFAGKVYRTGVLLTVTIWGIFFVLSILGTGLTGMPFLALITVVPLMAGLLVNTTASLIVFLLNLLLGAWLMYQESIGALPIGTTYEPMARWFTYQIIFGPLPLLVYLWRRSFKESIARIQQAEEAKRETAVVQAQKEKLEAAVAARTNALQASLQREHLLAQELERALAEQIQLNALKSRIIARVSHEFRTPLTVINTMTDLLFRHRDRLAPERQERYRDRVSASIFYLTDLLDDIMMVNVTESEGIRVSYQKMSFTAFCDRLVSGLLSDITSRDRISFQFDAADETEVWVDITLTKQVVTNLTTNALKYSEASATVTITMVHNNGRLQISVTDKGIGIPEAELARIFDLFYRASNVDARRGLGLGLHIAQTIIETMKGQITTHSIVDEGTTFIIYLPANRHNIPANGQVTAVSPSNSEDANAD